MLCLLIENPEAYDDMVRPDMHRWWRTGVKHHYVNGETLVELADGTRRVWLPESVKRLASFGVRARVVRRPL